MAGYLQERVNACRAMVNVLTTVKTRGFTNDRPIGVVVFQTLHPHSWFSSLTIIVPACFTYLPIPCEWRFWKESKVPLCSKITTVWRVFLGVLIFVESQRKPSELSYIISWQQPSQSRGVALHKRWSICALNLTRFHVTEPLLQTNSMR
jgi:hypothetical protein